MRLLFILVLMFAAAGAKSQQLTGHVSVIDGDTLKMDKHPIRLHGIDAPESRQECQIKLQHSV